MGDFERNGSDIIKSIINNGSPMRSEEQSSCSASNTTIYFTAQTDLSNNSNTSELTPGIPYNLLEPNETRSLFITSNAKIEGSSSALQHKPLERASAPEVLETIQENFEESINK